MAEKVIVITGAGGGLGQALARRLAADGDKVVLLGRTFSKLEKVAEEIGAAALAIQCELTSPQSVNAAFAQIAQAHGRIDVLINNAGLFEASALDEASDRLIIDSVMTNLAAPAMCARAAIPHIPRGGKIINVTSESVIMDLPYLVMYQAAKAGLERLSTALDRELYDRAIRVCVVRAGTMVGEGMAGHMEPETIQAMIVEAAKRGIDMPRRGFCSYDSTLDIFRLVIDAAPDLYIPFVGFHAFRPD